MLFFLCFLSWQHKGNRFPSQDHLPQCCPVNKSHGFFEIQPLPKRIIGYLATSQLEGKSCRDCTLLMGVCPARPPWPVHPGLSDLARPPWPVRPGPSALPRPPWPAWPAGRPADHRPSSSLPSPPPHSRQPAVYVKGHFIVLFIVFLMSGSKL